ncbi:MAG: hypothetical protein KAX78_09010, partial [Phycisphaerae bacterium]|nr:hypothetical protein [Phycisphaerae bacterium]
MSRGKILSFSSFLMGVFLLVLFFMPWLELSCVHGQGGKRPAWQADYDADGAGPRLGAFVNTSSTSDDYVPNRNMSSPHVATLTVVLLGVEPNDYEYTVTLSDPGEKIRFNGTPTLDIKLGRVNQKWEGHTRVFLTGADNGSTGIVATCSQLQDPPPVPATVFEVQVSDCDPDWLPKGGVEANTTSFTATIYPVSLEATIRFTLPADDVSDYPGYCTN